MTDGSVRQGTETQDGDSDSGSARYWWTATVPCKPGMASWRCKLSCVLLGTALLQVGARVCPCAVLPGERTNSYNVRARSLRRHFLSRTGWTTARTGNQTVRHTIQLRRCTPQNTATLT